MPPLGTIFKAFAASVAGSLALWFGAVRAVPRVKRRKLARGVGSRARRRRAATRSQSP